MDYHKSSSFNRPRVGSVYFVMEEIKEEVPEVTTAPSTASRRKVASPLSLVAIQFALLLWKNVLLQVYNAFYTCILCACFFSHLFFALVRNFKYCVSMYSVKLYC